ncbi:MAG TPA: hypothetical protein VG650_01040 [Mycobacteriales bacterium]|nr:hypothetical protein [Mycobacteriales bacterium]
MTPFLQFRLWIREAPAGERTVALCLAIVVMTVGAWSLVSVGPAGPPTSVGAASPTGGQAASSSPRTSGHHGRAAGTGGGPAVTGPSTGGEVGAGGHRAGVKSGSTTPGGASVRHGRSSGASAPDCGPGGSTDQGVTDKVIHVDVDVANLAGAAGNGLVGLPDAKVEKRMFGAAIDYVNRHGGVRCRALVAKYYTANPLSQSSLEALCLDMVADKPFALLDEGLASPVGSPTPRDCPPSHKLPEFGSLSLSQREVEQFSPYLFAYNETSEQIVHDSILASDQLRWFKGAKKVGLLEQDCIPDLNSLALADLAKIGFPKSSVTTFDFGCPNDIPSPITVENAVLRFKSAGVTHVLDDGGVYENYFSNDAANQHYRPKYMVGDQGSIALWDNRAFGPNPDNFAGALAITATQYGAENTAGATFNPQTHECDAAMKAKRLASATASPDGFAGVACTLVHQFVLAADNAPSLMRADLAAGLAAVGHADMPFPAGPANYVRSHGQYGGGYWRPDIWHSSCACFQLQRARFSPSFS